VGIGLVVDDTDLPVGIGLVVDDTDLPVGIGLIVDDTDLSVGIGPNVVLGANIFVNGETNLLIKELYVFLNFKTAEFLLFFNTAYEVDTIMTNSIINVII